MRLDTDYSRKGDRTIPNLINTMKHAETEPVHDQHLLERIEKLNAIGIALSTETDMPRLLEMLLAGAKLITRADGGTLYTIHDGNKLCFEIVRTTSLAINMGGTSDRPVQFKPISLFHRDGRPNNERVVAYAALNKKVVNLPDVYEDDSTDFDFTGPRLFDERMNYRTKSMLAVPMIDHDGNTVGVIQLINKQDKTTGDVVAFDADDIHLVKSLASQATIALTNKRLINDLKALFDSFVKAIAMGIDEKSPYTGGHCRRVPVLTLALAEAASEDNGVMKDFNLDKKDHYTLEVASWLHDCGKLVTPVHVVDKATKLETIHDRIHLIDTRFEVIKRDAEINRLNKLLNAGVDSPEADEINTAYLREIKTLDEDRDFIRQCNKGVESMAPELKERVKQIARRSWCNQDGETTTFFSEDELNNLLIQYGTLNSDERQIINDHIVVTNKMLQSMNFPEDMKQVPEYAGGHHERMDGKGYPNGLTREQMSVPARVMAIADVFEALTARDRPYKEAKKLSDSLAILGKMKMDKHIDPDLFDIFIHKKVYLPYAHEFMDPEMIDIEEPFEIPGYPFEMELTG